MLNLTAPKFVMCVLVLCLMVSAFFVTFVHSVQGAQKITYSIVNFLEIGDLWKDAVMRANAHVYNIVSDLLSFQYLIKIFYACALSVIAYFLYFILFVPINRVRMNEDIGYAVDPLRTKKDVANIVRQRRMVGDIPPVYPNGWYALMEGFHIKKQSSMSTNCLGMTLAVFRDESNKVHVIDAYCPHMGANLGVGGRISGDCIECPFHGWRFRGEDGTCTHIPGVDKIPDIARVKAWNTVEYNGWIYIWYHAEGAEPTWMVPEIDKITEGKWSFKGRAEHYISCHIQEIPENGADVLHLKQVHSPFIGGGVDLTHMYSKLWSFMEHEWSAQWEAQPDPNKHIGLMNLLHKVKVFGRDCSFLDLNVTAQQIGPGIVHLHFKSILGDGVFQMSVLPVEPLLQKCVFNIYCPWTIPTVIARVIQIGESMMVERDLMIWNNKRYVLKPLFTRSKEDALIARHRRWFNQFYSEHSPRLNFRQETTTDW